MSTSLTTSPRANAFVVRIPQPVIRELCAQLASTDGAGLLLGKVSENRVSVEALQPFAQGNPSKSFAGGSPSGDVVGWYATRPSRGMGLLDQDVEFHEQRFPALTDIALIFSPKRKDEVLVKIYARSPQTAFSSEDCRSGSVRLPLDGALPETIDVPVGYGVDPGSYLKVYDLSKSLDKHEVRAAAFRRVLWVAVTATFFSIAIAAIRIAYMRSVETSAAARFAAIEEPPERELEPASAPENNVEPILSGTTQREINWRASHSHRESVPAKKQEQRPTRAEAPDQRAPESPVSSPNVTAVVAGAPQIPPPVADTVPSLPPPGSALPPVSLPASASAPPPPEKIPAVQASSGGHLTAVTQEARDYTPPQPLTNIAPKAPPEALSSLTSPLEIDVEVKIDKSGRVTKARALNPGKASGAIVAAALSAARQWVFEPATLHGQKVTSQHTIVFQFRGN